MRPSRRGPRPSGPRSTRSMTSSTAPRPSCPRHCSMRSPRGRLRSSTRWMAAGRSGSPAIAPHPRRQPSPRLRAPDQGVAYNRAAALPGQSLVILDPRLMLATDIVQCEDGHAQERSLLDRILRSSRPRTCSSPTATSVRRISSSGSRGAAAASSFDNTPRPSTGSSSGSGGVRPDRHRQGL